VIVVGTLTAELVETAPGIPAGDVVDSASHRVQTVFVVVKRMVDVDVEISTLVPFPKVWVFVTGQRVVVVSTTTVVMTSTTLDEAGVVGGDTAGDDSVT